MQNLKTTALVLGFLICSLSLSAQFSYKKGFIINLQNDTLFGLVKDKGFEDLSQKVIFKADRKAIPETYLPADIKAFGFNDGDVFESFDISFQSPGWETINDKQFLNRLVFGKISLYELTDYNHPFFIKKEGGKLHLLCLRKSGKKIEKEYLDVLNLLMKDCPAVIVTDNIPLKRRALIDLVRKYNRQCSVGFSMENYENARMPRGSFTLFTGIPYPYIERYGGFGKGMMMEIGGKHFSAIIGVEHIKGVKDKTEEVDFNYNFVSTLLRLNYRFFDSGKLSPYVFAGANFLWSSRTVDDEIFDYIHAKFDPTLEYGAGIDFFFTERFFLKAEVASPHFPNIRLGLGFLIK